MGVIYSEGNFRSSSKKVKIINNLNISGGQGSSEKLIVEEEILTIEDKTSYSDELLNIG